MDAFAVSVCKGLAQGSTGPRQWMAAGLWFGGFQFIMPIIGYLIGGTAAGALRDYACYVAAAIIAVIGLNMIREAVAGDPEDYDGGMGIFTMFLLAVATSIDALAAGVSLGLQNTGIVISAAIIGTITFSLSAAGMAAAGKVRGISTRNACIIGGAVLVLIAVKTVLENVLRTRTSAWLLYG